MSGAPGSGSGSNNPSGVPLGNDGQAMVQYRPLVSRRNQIPVTVAGEVLLSGQHFRNILDRLNPDQVIEAFRQVQNQIRMNAEGLQDIALETWEIQEQRPEMQEYRRGNAASFNREFNVLRDGAHQATVRRNRAAASLRTLSSWMTQDFLDTIVTEQTSRSTAVLDALVAAYRDHSNHRLTPVQLFRRASAFRLQRIVGIGPYNRSSGEASITVQDIRFAYATTANGPDRDFAHPLSVDARRESDAMSRLGVTADAQGIHWHDGVQHTGAQRAYQNDGAVPRQRGPVNPGTSHAASHPSITKSIDPNLIITGKRYTEDVLYHGMDKAPTTGKKRDPQPTWEEKPKVEDPAEASTQPKSPDVASPLPKRPKNGRFGPTPVDIMDLINELHTMSLGPGSPRWNREKVKPQRNPLRNPTALDRAIWSQATRKAQAIRESRPPRVLSAQEIRALRNATGSMTDIYNSVTRLTGAIRQNTSLDDSNLFAYLEGLADGGSAAYAAYNHDQVAVADIRRLANDFHRTFGDRRGRIGDGNEYHQGIEVAQANFDTLMRDERHSGWLDSVVLMAALLGIVRGATTSTLAPNAFVLHVDHVYGYRTGGLTIDQIVLPRARTNLVIPFHWGNHWTVGLVNMTERTITHMDSRADTDRHAQAMAAMEQLLYDARGRFGTESWTHGTATSGRQRNDDDCGIWVIENARGMLEGTDHRASVSPATRRFVAEELLHHLQRWTALPQGPTQRHTGVTQAQPSPALPFRVGTFAPGPDRPFLANVQQPPPPTSPARSLRQSSAPTIPQRPARSMRQSSAPPIPQNSASTIPQSPARSIRQSPAPSMRSLSSYRSSITNPFEQRARSNSGRSSSGASDWLQSEDTDRGETP